MLPLNAYTVLSSHLTPDSLPGRVKQIVHKAFWDRLEEDLNEDPPEYGHAIKLFEEIKEVGLWSCSLKLSLFLSCW